jgi:type VI secretion system secreted protein VgrG
MATATQKTRHLTIETPLGKDHLLLTSFNGQEEISRLFRYDLELLSEDFAIKPGEIVGKNVTFGLTRSSGVMRYFNGFVRRFRAGTLTGSGKFRRYSAEIVPWLWFLTRTTDCRIFQFKKAPAIIEQIFSDLGFSDFDFSRLRGEYPERTYCVQYRESDFDFVSRLMEEEGIFYDFRHENGKHTLILADGKTGYRPGAEANLICQQGGTSHVDAERIDRWEHRYTFETGKWSYRDYNFEKPKADLTAKEKACHKFAHAENFEEYDYPGEYETKDDGRRLTRIRIEEEEAGHDTVEAESNCPTLSPGETFSLKDHEIPSENKGYVVTCVTHEIREPIAYETEQGGNGNGHGNSGGPIFRDEMHYRNTFACMPDAVVFRPERITRRPVVEGPQTAVVVGPPGEEIYPDEYGRVKVQFHWDREGKRDESSSCWIRVSQIHAGQGWGAMDIPRIGEEVIVDFLEGDPDRPIITGRVYNGENMPPFALPAEKTRRGNKTKTYKGSGYNEMTMDDTPGKEQIRTNAQYNMDTAVGNNKTLIVGVDKSAEIGNNDTTKVGHDSTESVGNNKLVQVGNNMNVNVGKNLVVNAGSTITLKCGASRIFMNSGGVITITGTLITTAAAVNASVIAPMTQVIGGVLMTTVGGVNMMEGGVTYVGAIGLASVSGGKTDVAASSTTTVKGSVIHLN